MDSCVKTKFLKNISFEDVWTRLSEAEKSVCCTRNSGEAGLPAAALAKAGWESFIAWNPQDIFSSAGANIGHWRKFVKKQQKLGCRTFGYLSYDLSYALHDIAPHARNVLRLPEILFFAFDRYARAHPEGMEICARNDEDLRKFSAEVENILSRDRRKTDPPARTIGSELETTVSFEEYSKGFEEIRRYIIDGHVYQINLTHPLCGSTAKSARELFGLVYEKNKADFSAYMEGNGFEILSASPERFIKISPDRTIETFPVKGTRPRGETPAEDRERERELEESDKEAAELFMITDLLRNDVGKICDFGSVSVENPRVTRSFAAVWHALSHIRGRLREKVRSADALLSMFPGGSISGCPKKRALEIIDEIEPTMRGAYTGSIGFIDPDDSLDFNIAIRTMIKQGEKVRLQVGGGIVYDSVAEDEYQETLDKAKSFLGIL